MLWSDLTLGVHGDELMGVEWFACVVSGTDGFAFQVTRQCCLGAVESVRGEMAHCGGPTPRRAVLPAAVFWLTGSSSLAWGCVPYVCCAMRAQTQRSVRFSGSEKMPGCELGTQRLVWSLGSLLLWRPCPSVPALRSGSQRSQQPGAGGRGRGC